MARTPRVPSYRLHRATGQAVVTLNGHDHYLGRHDSPESRRRYDRLIAEWLAAGRYAAADAGPARTVSEVAAAHLAWAQAYYVKDGEPTTQADRIRRSLSVLRGLYGGEPAASFGPKALKAVQAAMVGKGWCRVVVNQRVELVRACFRWAVSEELVPPSLVHGLECVKALEAGRTAAPESEPITPAPEASIGPALAALQPTLADVARVQLLTAARPGEVLRMRAAELDRAGDVWLYRPATWKMKHKVKRPRVILVGPRAQQVLASYLLRRAEGYLFSPADSMARFRAEQRAARRTPVQPSQRDRKRAAPKRQPGERYLVTSYSRAVARACERAGVEPWHPHQLRHNAATRLEEEFGWEVARIILGHASVDMTRIYVKENLAKAAEVMRKVG